MSRNLRMIIIATSRQPYYLLRLVLRATFLFLFESLYFLLALRDCLFVNDLCGLCELVLRL